jgi:PAS domain S-box-containing protein
MEKKSVLTRHEFVLSEATLNDLPEGVLWVDEDGLIVYLNPTAASLLRRSREELTNQPIYTCITSDSFKSWLLAVADKSDTNRFIVDDKSISIFFLKNISVEGKRHRCFLIKKAAEPTRESSEMLRIISEGTASVIGGDFFKSLAYHIIRSTGIRYAIITECANVAKTRVRTLVYIERDHFLDNFEYDLTGTPCEIVMRGENYYCSADLDTFFPKDEGVKSYFGVPIFLSSGEIAGHIAIFDTKPLTISNENLNILKIFASRAGAEIERKVADQKLTMANAELEVLLKESEERFRDLFEEAPIAYVHEGLDSKFIKANRAALRILGVRPDEVPTIYGKTLAPNTPDAQRRMKEAFESVGRGTDTSGVVLELRRKDNGTPIWIQWWSNPDPGGLFTRTMFLDITDRILMEQEQAQLQAQNQYLQDEIKLAHNFNEIMSKSKLFQSVLEKVEQVASTDATVLILGESGTGKELLARAVHSISNRSNRPLVKVNCAALPANLIESELFGHEKGAFTGALAAKVGRFELANGGTLFLDEIGELPLELQSKLLRVLQEGEFERVGSSKTLNVDVRIIAATNRELEASVNNKEFRADLYYRLNVFPIYSPPLRDRKEDIPVLVNHFSKKYGTKFGKKISVIPKSVMDALLAYDWPGNVRELENIIERGLIISTTDTFEIGDWLPKTSTKQTALPPSSIQPHIQNTNAKKSLEDVERQHITEILNRTNWKIRGEDGAAKILKLNPTTLEARMKKFCIVRRRE